MDSIPTVPAKFVHTYMSMTLRIGSREFYYEQLDKFFPGIKEKYIKQYGIRKHCQPTKYKKLWNVFSAECERLGLLYDMRAISHKYKSGYEDRQMTLFDF